MLSTYVHSPLQQKTLLLCVCKEYFSTIQKSVEYSRSVTLNTTNAFDNKAEIRNCAGNAVIAQCKNCNANILYISSVKLFSLSYSMHAFVRSEVSTP